MRVKDASPQVMGIINVTPDSFSGDGLLHENYVMRALSQAMQMLADGAALLDIGGESSRPGAAPVTVEEELRRVIPVVAAIRKNHGTVPIAVDTVKAEVAEQAIQAGATIINDITALQNGALRAVVAQHKVRVVLMHNRAQAAMRSEIVGGHYDAPAYDDVVADVARDLQASVEAAVAAGVARDKIILDPGIGFGKTPAQNLSLIAHVHVFKEMGFPVLMGVSRKSFIGHILDTPVEERTEGTAACVAACILNGADIVRVHEVKFMGRVVKMAAALRDA